MKIAYKKRHLNINLILGLVWLTLFFVGMLLKDKLNWINYNCAAIATIYLTGYFYQREHKYLTVANGVLKVNSPFGKKIELTKIKQIKKFAGDYTLKTDKTALTINTQIIDSNALAELNNLLKKLEVEWN